MRESAQNLRPVADSSSRTFISPRRPERQHDDYSRAGTPIAWCRSRRPISISAQSLWVRRGSSLAVDNEGNQIIAQRLSTGELRLVRFNGTTETVEALIEERGETIASSAVDFRCSGRRGGPPCRVTTRRPWLIGMVGGAQDRVTDLLIRAAGLAQTGARTPRLPALLMSGIPRFLMSASGLHPPSTMIAPTRPVPSAVMRNPVFQVP
jgi:hypothetical protein